MGKLPIEAKKEHFVKFLSIVHDLSYILLIRVSIMYLLAQSE